MLLAFGLTVLASPARAEKVAIASFKMSGELADTARAALRASLAGGLAAAGYDVLTDETLAKAMKEAPGLGGCETTACLKRLASVAGADRVLRGSLEVLGSSYHFSMELLGPDGNTVARIDDDCQVCNAKEANDSLSTAAANLKPKPIIKPPPPPPPVRQKMSLFKTLGIATAVAGGAVLITGIALVAVDGNFSGPPRTKLDPSGTQTILERQRLHTLGGGISLMLVGAGLAGAAGVLFWKDSRRPKVDVSAWLDPTSAGLSAAGAF